jgi:hypothetical protein
MRPVAGATIARAAVARARRAAERIGEARGLPNAADLLFVQEWLEFRNHLLDCGPQLSTRRFDDQSVSLSRRLENGEDRGPLVLVARLNCFLHVLDEPSALTQSLQASHAVAADCTRCENTDDEANDQRG